MRSFMLWKPRASATSWPAALPSMRMGICGLRATLTLCCSSPENIRAAFSALAGISYRPIVPINAADSGKRSAWVQEKGMTVLNFWSEQHRDTPVDVFVTEPFDFDAEYGRALVKRLGSIEVRFVSIPCLIRMKEN